MKHTYRNKQDQFGRVFEMCVEQLYHTKYPGYSILCTLQQGCFKQLCYSKNHKVQIEASTEQPVVDRETSMANIKEL